mgnify:FL=1
MKTRDFLCGVLGDEGHYCILALKPTENRKVQKFFSSIDELQASAYDLDAEGYDTYFATARFKEPNSRKVDNVTQLKSFFLDLDCGEGKDFEDRNDALNALKRFCAKLSLPKPVLIDSGRGIHVYWRLKEAIGINEWTPVAERLKKLCVEHGLYADAAVTADAARVLRIPNTHNHKTDPPTEVKLLSYSSAVDFDHFNELLGGDMIPVPTKVENTTAFLDAVHSNIISSFDDIIVKSRGGTGCEQLRRVVDEPNTQSEPVWVSAISIAKHCDDAGRDKAHELSRGYDGYDAEETDTKYNNIKYPHTCSTFDERVNGVCTDCPHFGKVKSPIVLGQKIAEAEEEVVQEPAIDLPNAPISTYTIPTYPKPYFRGKNGGVYVRSSDADGEIDEKMIYHNDLYVVRRLKDKEVGEAIVMRLHLPKDGVREFTVPLTAVTSREEFRKAMSSQGVAVTKMDELMSYTTTWVNELQATIVADEAHTQFGWTNDKCEAFILGNTEIRGNEFRFNPPSTQTADLFSAFEPKGTLQGWSDMANFYAQDGMELHQYVMGTAFGSPLMALTSVSCSTMHLHSKGSGHGKTTALMSAATVWGNPKKLVLDEVDTHASKMNRGEVYKNLPLYIDELTNSRGKQLSDLVYQLTSGKQRGRMQSGSNQERARGDTWACCAVTNGNVSAVETISGYKNAPIAEAQRMLECKAGKTHFVSKEVTDDFSETITDNWGQAGSIYIQYVINNIEQVRKTLKTMQVRLDKKAGLKAENRFWSAGVACTLTGLLIAKHLGLIDYDLKKVEKWALKQLEINKNTVSDMTVSVQQIINDFITDHYNSMLWIKSTQRFSKEQDNGMDMLVIPDAIPRSQKLVARYEPDTKLIFIIPKYLKSWSVEQQINYGQLVTDLKEKMGATYKKTRLTKGTAMDMNQYCYIFKIDIDVPEGVEVGSGDS